MHKPQLRRLAACVALCFGATDAAQGSLREVTDCTDGVAAGSLRNTIASAVSNDTVEIKANVCSKITLTTGHAIVVGVGNLTITGPGQEQLTISGGYDAVPEKENQIFNVTGGKLSVENLTLAHAKYFAHDAPYGGGCISSTSEVYLKNVTVTDCNVISYSPIENASHGGAIYAHGRVTLLSSTVTQNSILNATPTGDSRGGGIYAYNSLSMTGSEVSHNVASSGGGVYVGAGTLSIARSTISYNYATSTAGGVLAGALSQATLSYSTLVGNSAIENSAIQLAGLTSASYFQIQNSTISGNIASSDQTVAAYLPTFVYNSTIAFNHAGSSNFPVGLFSNLPINIDSSIIANNGNYDVGSSASHGTLLSGSGNLITASLNPLPSGTITSCPKLEPLAHNGGPLPTHALQSTSPAINVGNLTGGSLLSDERGLPRNVNGVDIGAFERQPTDSADDRIFVSEFEGRCD